MVTYDTRIPKRELQLHNTVETPEMAIVPATPAFASLPK